MTEFDWDLLFKNDEEYQGIADAVSEYFRGEWDDEIHDSFHEYVIQVQELSSRLHGICLAAREMGDEMVILDVDTLNKLTDDLWREEEGV